MKTNLRYVGKQLGIVLLLAVIAIIILQLVWSLVMELLEMEKIMVHSLSDTWSEIIGKLTRGNKLLTKIE
ncbi:MAG: DNA-directed RNA polymerase subunit beta [Streptococcus sp.]